MGKALFLCEYDIYKRQNVHQKDVNIIVSKQIDLINTTRISNHSIDGLVGFVHGMSFLFGKNIIEVIDENDFFSEVDPFLIALSNEYLRKNEFDSFDGFIGIANMMLERVKKNTEFIPIIDKHINHIMSYYEAIINKKTNIAIDFSISHGISAVLQFITIYAEITYQVHNYRDFIKQLCYLILFYSEDNRFLDYFDKKQSIKRIAPLRWCRGDLSISYVLAKSAKLLEDNFLLSEVKKTVDILSKKRILHEQELYSATLCHGTLGVAYVFSKINSIYCCPMIQEAKNYWYSESLSILNSKKGYLYVDHNGNQIELGGILNGKEGIGLALLAYLSQDTLALDTFLQLK